MQFLPSSSFAPDSRALFASTPGAKISFSAGSRPRVSASATPEAGISFSAASQFRISGAGAVDTRISFPGAPGTRVFPAGATDKISISATAESLTSGSDAHGFARLIRQHLEGRPAVITPLENGIADSNAHSAVGDTGDMFASQSPYLKASSKYGAVSTSSAQEIRFTPTEVDKIGKALQEFGVDPAVVLEIMKLADSPLGVTAPDMLKAMAEIIHRPAQVTDGDIVRTSSLLQRLDPGGSLSGQILADVRNGKTVQAWQKIMGALQALDPETSVALEHDEVLSLGKSLGLSAQTLDALHKAFAGNSRLELAPEQVERFLSLLQNELGERQAQLEKLAVAFEKALLPVAQEARMRIVAEESAAGRAARNTQHSAVLIEDTVTRNGLTRQNSAAAPQEDGAVVTQRLENLLRRAADEGTAGGENRWEDAEAGNQNRKDGWTDLLNRIRYQAAGEPNQGRMSDMLQAASVVPAASQPGQAAQSAAGQPAQPPYAPQVLRQVEQGLLTGMRDGSQRLELQLSPEHLGALTMVLTIKNGEVSALLRPERSETAVLLNQQTDQLRFSLEQQGIKVDKVEVQLQMQDERNAMTWQGMAQHNASQERQTRAEQGRILRLGRLHRGEFVDLDQKMHASEHSAGQSADLAGQGLHIIT